MKPMITLDFIVARTYLAQEAIVSIPIGIIVSFFIGNVYTMPAAFAALVPFVIGFSLFALDEKNDWEQFRLALPLSRENVITGRYATCALLAVAGILFGAIICLLTIAIASIAPSLPNASQIVQSTEAMPAIAAPCAGAIANLAMLAIAIPAIAKCGMTKAVRFIPLIAVLLVCLAIGAFGGGEAIVIVEAAIDEASSTAADFTLLLFAAAVVAMAIYAASCTLSCKLYRHREL